jgi:ferredoxin-NADP reductase
MIALPLQRTIQETPDITTFQFDKLDLRWTAGQYMAFVMPGVSPILEQYEHWFSISSAPSQLTLDISVRFRPTPFKQALWSMQPGDAIQTHTIDGHFSWPDEQAHPVFIAGGIGITPFISMLRQRQFEGRPLKADLHYFNRPDAPVPFKDELDAMGDQHPELHIYHSSEKPLSLTPIYQQATLPDSAQVFVAGPVPMVDRLSQELQQQNIPHQLDWYFGYGINNY